MIDALKAVVDEAVVSSKFSLAWDPLGREMTILFVMYMIMACFYFFSHISWQALPKILF